MANNDLVVAFPAPLWPVSGGGPRRALDLIAWLRKKGLRVTLVAEHHGEGNAALAARCDELVTLRPLHPGPPPPWAFTQLKRIIANSPVGDWLRPAHGGLERMRRRALEDLVVATVERERPAAVLVHFAHLAYCLERMPRGVLRIVDTIDVQHLRPAAARSGRGQIDRTPCTRAEEAAALAHADVVLAIERSERDILQELCPSAVAELVGYAADAAEFDPSPDTSRDILFVGNRYDPNVRGLKAFLDRVWPSVRRACPDARLVVCGRVGETIGRAPRGVEVRGTVDDLSKYYRHAAVVVNPAPYGTGQAVKSIEALAHGRALVSTPVGTRGLHTIDEPPWRTADVGTEMAEIIVGLLMAGAARHSLERRAHEYAVTRLAPDAVYAPLLAHIR